MKYKLDSTTLDILYTIIEKTFEQIKKQDVNWTTLLQTQLQNQDPATCESRTCGKPCWFQYGSYAGHSYKRIGKPLARDDSLPWVLMELGIRFLDPEPCGTLHQDSEDTFLYPVIFQQRSYRKITRFADTFQVDPLSAHLFSKLFAKDPFPQLCGFGIPLTLRTRRS